MATINVPYQEFTQADLDDPNLVTVNNFFRGLYTSVQTLNNQVQATTVASSTGSASTGMIAAGATAAVTVNLAPRLANNSFTPSISVQDATGSLQVISFNYLKTAGAGVTVYVKNGGSKAVKGQVVVRATLS